MIASGACDTQAHNELHVCLMISKTPNWPRIETSENSQVIWSQPPFFSILAVQLGHSFEIPITNCSDASSSARFPWGSFRSSNWVQVSPSCHLRLWKTHALNRHTWHRKIGPSLAESWICPELHGGFKHQRKLGMFSSPAFLAWLSNLCL